MGRYVCGDGKVRMCAVIGRCVCVCMVMKRCVYITYVCRSYSTVTECSLTPNRTGIATLSPFYSKEHKNNTHCQGRRQRPHPNSMLTHIRTYGEVWPFHHTHHPSSIPCTNPLMSTAMVWIIPKRTNQTHFHLDRSLYTILSVQLQLILVNPPPLYPRNLLIRHNFPVPI